MKAAVASFLLIHAPRAPTTTAYHVVNPESISRREWFTDSAAFGLASVAIAPPSAFAAETFQTYNDVAHDFSISIPTAWQSTEQTLADRRKILVWTDAANAATSLFIAYTSVRDDFTSLGSFGSVDQVAAQTILPKGKLMDETSEVSATMLSAVSTKQAYIFDYTQKVGTAQPETHFRTVFVLRQGATGGAGAVLVTITAQTPEATYSTVKPTLDAIIESYGKSA